MTRDDDTIRRLLTDAAPASRGVSAEAVARRAGRAQRRRNALTLVAVPVATLAVIGAAVAGVELLRDDASGPVGQPTQTVTDVPAGLIPWVETPAAANDAPDSWRELTVQVKADGAQLLDGFLVYEVDLTNPTASDISFADRCPSYVESLHADLSGRLTGPSDNLLAKESHQLNCSDMTVISAGQTVRYEMKLTMPDGVGGTPLLMSWDMAGPDMPSGTSSVVIANAPQTGSFTYTSPKGVVIKLDDFPSGKAISSPVTITGQVPGSWSFEADFPVVLTDWDGKIIAQGIGTLQGDWMTEDLVPFTVTLKFKTPTYNNTGSLILQKDNPSGEAKFDDAVEIPVTFTDAPAAAGELLDYSDLNDGSGAEVLPDGDTSQLAGAPADFVAFIADLAHQTGVTGKDCPDAYHGVHVSKLRSDGFAIGGVNDCGGGIAIWAVVDGSWQQVVFTQEAPQCADLRRYAIPSDIAGSTCYDRSGSLVEYSQP